MKPWQGLPALLRREGALQGRPAGIEHCLATSLAHWHEGLTCSTRLACLACMGGPKLALYLGPFSLHIHILPSLCRSQHAWQLPAGQRHPLLKLCSSVELLHTFIQSTPGAVRPLHLGHRVLLACAGLR